MIPLETTVLKRGPLSPLIVKLGLYGQLSDHDVDTIGDLRYTAIDYRRNQRITTLSVIPPCVYVMVSGLACLSVLASDGRRQITRFLLPGDFCNVFDAEPIGSIEGIDILAPTRMAAVPAGVFHQLGASPTMNDVLMALVTNATAAARKTIGSLGLGNARGRIAFLLYEFAQTMVVRGLIGAPTDPLPLRQDHIADATGLTNVHVNRMIAQLRRDRILSGSGTVLEIADMTGLRSIAGIKW